MFLSNVFCHGGLPAKASCVVSPNGRVTVHQAMLTLSCSAGFCKYRAYRWYVYGGVWPDSKTARSVSLLQFPANQLLRRTSEKHFPQPVNGHL